MNPTKPIALLLVALCAGCSYHNYHTTSPSVTRTNYVTTTNFVTIHVTPDVEKNYLRHRQALMLIEAHTEFTAEQCRIVALRSLTNDTTIPLYKEPSIKITPNAVNPVHFYTNYEGRVWRYQPN